MVDGERAGVIDVDDAVAGDPAADLGWFVSQIERDVLNGLLPPGRIEEATEALLAGYGVVATCCDPARIRLYVAAGLLHRSIYPFWSRKSDWPAGMAAMLERAEELGARG